jgi:hypothetical protein
MSPPVPAASGWIAAEFKADELALIAGWLARREGGRAPRLAAVDAQALKPLLPHLQLHERTADGRYLCRMSGAACVQTRGSDSTGKHLDEVVTPEVYAGAKQMFDRALENGRPLRYRGRALVIDTWRKYRRLLLPLRQHGDQCDTLLSLLRYKPAEPHDRPSPRASTTILGSWELSEADLAASFPQAAAA